MRSLPFALLAVLVLAGCAGSVARTYSLDKTRECLADKGARIGKPRGDIVASTASDGTFRAYLPGTDENFVTLSFGSDPTEANELVEGYGQFHAKNIGLSDILFTAKNVALLWKIHPATDDSDLVTNCLK